METAFLFAIYFLFTVFVIILINKFINSKIMILVDALVILVSLVVLYFICTANSPIKVVHKAAYDYYSCAKAQLHENDCNEAISRLKASKVKAEISGADSSLLSKTIELASYEANPQLKESPYDKINKSLEKFPLFIPPKDDDFNIYDSGYCQYIDKPIYQIVGWATDQITNRVYVAVIKRDDCPQQYEISDFPFITSQQFENLKDGNYWQNRPNDIFPYYTQKIVLVQNLQFSLDDLKTMPETDAAKAIKNTDSEKNHSIPYNSENNNSNTNTEIQSGSVDISDIENLGSYGKSGIELYKTKKSCFISIYGKNDKGDKGVIFWNPKYPEWLVLYPNMSTTIDAIKFARKNKSKLEKEIVTDYVFGLGKSMYATKGVYIGNTIVKLANMPIANLKDKLIDADNITLHQQNSINSSQNNDDIIFGLDGFEEATKFYESLCKDRF